MLYIWQGHRFGYDRSTCDKMFLNHMLATCTGRKRLVNCQHSAEIFWSAVRVGAYFHYHETAPAYCSEPWISQCLAWKITCIQNSFFVYILLNIHLHNTFRLVSFFFSNSKNVRNINLNLNIFNKNKNNWNYKIVFYISKIQILIFVSCSFVEQRIFLK